MNIGGIQKFSLIDYPEKIAALLFTQGCNFRCPFCHNPELVLPEKFGPLIREEDIFAWLQKRRGQLEGIVVTGGEPTLHSDLPEFMAKIKALGFSLKLDTNGSNPQMLGKLINSGLVDFVAMDVKAPLNKYSTLCGTGCDLLAIKESIELIISSGLKHQFRTTLVRPLLEYDDVAEIMELIRGSKSFRIQKFVNSGKVLDPSLLSRNQFSLDQFDELQKTIETKMKIACSQPLPEFSLSPDQAECV